MAIANAVAGSTAAAEAPGQPFFTCIAFPSPAGERFPSIKKLPILIR
jgi:hypothetical protein